MLRSILTTVVTLSLTLVYLTTVRAWQFGVMGWLQFLCKILETERDLSKSTSTLCNEQIH